MNRERLDDRPVLSKQDFAAFGVGVVAYVKPIVVKGAMAYSIHAADGSPLSVVPAREVAFAAVRRHDMEPVSVH